MHDAKITDTVIPTQRLELRPFTPEDAAEIFAAITPELTRFMAWEPPASPAVHADVWRNWVPAMAAGTDLHLVIRLKDGGEFLGRAGLHAIGSAEPELGIWIKETAQSRGYGSEAIAASAAWPPRALPLPTSYGRSPRRTYAVDGSLRPWAGCPSDRPSVQNTGP